MAARKTTTPKVTTKVIVSKAIYAVEVEDPTSAIRILQNDDGKLNITRVSDSYGYNPKQPELWDSCDDSVTLTVVDLKAIVEALDA